MKLETIKEFQNKIWNFYHQNQRSFTWREEITPYKIVVSEIMLQQTQTSRVIDKFTNWMSLFPSWKSLAQASELQVLQAWQGLGYNRRGLALRKIAQIVTSKHESKLPSNLKTLESFPQIGPNTAASICAFAFNLPVTFIETNVRTVFTHEFFPGKENVHDKELLQLIEKTVDHKNSREWYYALMDYGNHLKKSLKNINSASKHYSKQSRFKGSKREIRGFIIKQLTQQNHLPFSTISDSIKKELFHNKHDALPIVETMKKEKIIKVENNTLFI
jgi:A/G-specific adenine glycosylase